MLKLKLQYFGHLIQRTDSLKRPWSWERLKMGGEGDDRRWDGWMASPTQWTWIWADSGSWWWTGRPGVLQSMGLQRVRRDLVTELNWTLGQHCLPRCDSKQSNPKDWHSIHKVVHTGIFQRSWMNKLWKSFSSFSLLYVNAVYWFRFHYFTAFSWSSNTEDSFPSLHLKDLRLLSTQPHVNNSFHLLLLFPSSPGILTAG